MFLLTLQMNLFHYESVFVTWYHFLLLFHFQVFVLHHLIKAIVLEGGFPENPLLNLRTSSMNSSEKTLGVDVRSVNFGTELSLGAVTPLLKILPL